MPEKGQQGVPLAVLLEIGGLIRARVLVCQHELEHRTARTVTLLTGSFASDESQSENCSFVRSTLQADQLEPV